MFADNVINIVFIIFVLCLLLKIISGHVIIPLVEHISMDERLEVAKNLEKLRAIASKEPCKYTSNRPKGHLEQRTSSATHQAIRRD